VHEGLAMEPCLLELSKSEERKGQRACKLGMGQNYIFSHS